MTWHVSLVVSQEMISIPNLVGQNESESNLCMAKTCCFMDEIHQFTPCASIMGYSWEITDILLFMGSIIWYLIRLWLVHLLFLALLTLLRELGFFLCQLLPSVNRRAVSVASFLVLVDEVISAKNPIQPLHDCQTQHFQHFWKMSATSYPSISVALEPLQGRLQTFQEDQHPRQKCWLGMASFVALRLPFSGWKK